MMLVADRCRREGIACAGVHDSFWTHAGDAARLAPLIRDAFVELHGQPLLEELHKDLTFQLAATGLSLPPLPKQGSLNIESVGKSPYFFL
jgi:DNA-directed RNA polymerase